MKNFIMMMLVAVASMFSMTANAQYNVQEHRFFDNWSVGVHGGVQTNLCDWNAPQGAVAGITLNKQITPVYGLTFEGTLGVNNTANWLHPNQTHIHNGYAVDNVAVFSLGRVNLMNWFAGYNGSPRLFEVEALAGVGYGAGWMKYDGTVVQTVKDKNDNWLVKAGANLNFNLGKQKAWTVNVQPAVVWGLCDRSGIDMWAGNAVFQATAGVTYHFGATKTKAHHFTPVPVPAPVEVVREVVKEVPVTVEVVREVEKVVENEATAPQKLIIGFAFDSAELSPEAKEALLDLAHGVKEATVVAYSSYEDKTAANYNMKLSESRANVIANFLRENGVNVLKEEGLGSPNKESNRIAIVVGK